MVSGSARSESRRLVIEIIGRFGIAVGDEDVLVSIVVEVGKQGTPAPVGVRDARQASDFTKDDVPVLRDAVAQLQRIDVVIVAKPSAAQVHATAIREIPAHPLASLQ